ncbi:MAG: amidohydrolase [Alphaproteobacteria bacterium]|nr:amidohydrolase [Alphaproteobacteria bacterium]PPR14731.1 MAG: hypothetical protein CFH42_00492 [Alphaproteobacteria bacterium MarineAlpha12_Bin1]|tara:strand:- start:12679 stop:13692 length:1014 start_codon:yes stop_codon:yes gene_type:complete
MGTNDNWLSLVQEDALDPKLPICDPHHHLWDFRTDQTEPRYLLEELLADLNCGHNIVSTVFIECGAMYRNSGPKELSPVGETEYVNNLVSENSSNNGDPVKVASGIIGHADLLLGDRVKKVLEEHILAAGDRFKGIRHSVPWDSSDDVPVIRGKRPPNLLQSDLYREGFSNLKKFNLSYEAWLYHPQISELIELARLFPDTVIILNHLGGPLGVGPYKNKGEEVFRTWKSDIADLATCPNVFSKLGGMHMEINGFDWHKRSMPPTSLELLSKTRPWYEFIIEKFGVERCLFESNFPVDKLSCSYSVLWNSFKRLTKDYSESEKSFLFHDTAAQIYRL